MNTLINNEIYPIEIFIDELVPEFIRTKYPVFTEFIRIFIEKYSEEGNGAEFIQNLTKYMDVDNNTNAEIFERFCKQYLKELKYLPQVNKKTLIKWIKQWYTSIGNEESFKFLFRVLYNTNVEVYYPSKDMLRISDGFWAKEKIICVELNTIDTNNNKMTNEEVDFFYKDLIGTEFISTQTGSKGLIDDVTFEAIELLNEEFFIDSEKSKYKRKIFVKFTVSDHTIFNKISNLVEGEYLQLTNLQEPQRTVLCKLSTIISEINTVGTSSCFYSVGDKVSVSNDAGYSAIAIVGSINSGDIKDVNILYGGTGYEKNDRFTFVEEYGYGGYGVVTEVDGNGSIVTVKVIQGGTNYMSSPKIVWEDIVENRRNSNNNVQYEDAVLTVVTENIGTIKNIDLLHNGYNYNEPTWDTINYPYDACFYKTLLIKENKTEPYIGINKAATIAGYTPQSLMQYKEQNPPTKFLLSDSEKEKANNKVFAQVEFNVIKTQIERNKVYRFPIWFSANSSIPQFKPNCIVEYEVLNNNDEIIYNVLVGDEERKHINKNDIIGYTTGTITRNAQITKIVNESLMFVNFLDIYKWKVGDIVYEYNEGNYITEKKIRIKKIYQDDLTYIKKQYANQKEYYKNTNGFISSEKKIQDSYYYQIFSYVLISKTRKKTWNDDVKQTLHPEGLLVFGGEDKYFYENLKSENNKNKVISCVWKSYKTSDGIWSQ